MSFPAITAACYASCLHISAVCSVDLFFPTEIYGAGKSRWNFPFQTENSQKIIFLKVKKVQRCKFSWILALQNSSYDNFIRYRKFKMADLKKGPKITQISKVNISGMI